MIKYFTLLLLLLPNIGHAEESIYSPEHCEFSITFPAEPYTTKRCEDGHKDRCYDQISYTKVYPDLGSTVTFRIICNPVPSEMIESYDGDVMQTTLRAMTGRSVVQTYDTNFTPHDDYKQATLIGEGKSGTLSTLYIAQLWIGKSSAFSVEAELIGNPAAEPDTLFSEILKSVQLKGDVAESAPPNTPEEKN